MSRRERPSPPQEIHVHIGRLVSDAPLAGMGDAAGFEAALQVTLAQRLRIDASNAEPSSGGFDARDAVADAVAARVHRSLATPRR